DFYQTYLVCKKNYGVFDGYCSDLLNYKETLEKMKKNRFSIDPVYTQLRAEIEVNKNLLNNTKDSISKFEKEAREFSFLILVNNDKKVFISQRINLFKDYYEKYQVVGGKKESNELFLDCAIREAKEESGVEIKIEDLNLIRTCEGFRVFPNSEEKQILYCTAIYYSIIDQIPQQLNQKIMLNGFQLLKRINEL
ncbi:15948_t:CDS:1, partial [Cetraspora pellucida]